MDPLHAVLQTKFNLYGTPFERELFDIEPPLLAKQTVRLFMMLKKNRQGLISSRISFAIRQKVLLDLYHHLAFIPLPSPTDQW